MATDKPRNMSASIRQRLVNHSAAIKTDPNLVLIWYGLERFLQDEVEVVREVFASICAQTAEDDGLIFDATSVKVAEIRDTQEYGGFRILLTARLGTAVLRPALGSSKSVAASWMTSTDLKERHAFTLLHENSSRPTTSPSATGCARSTEYETRHLVCTPCTIRA
jgi:hypothetical protein